MLLCNVLSPTRAVDVSWIRCFLNQMEQEMMMDKMSIQNMVTKY